MLLILALRKAEAGGSVSSRQAWFTRTSSRTGFKNTEKLCLNKPKKRKKEFHHVHVHRLPIKQLQITKIW